MVTITAILEPDSEGFLHLPVPPALRGGKVRVVAELEPLEPSETLNQATLVRGEFSRSVLVAPAGTPLMTPEQIKDILEEEE